MTDELDRLYDLRDEVDREQQKLSRGASSSDRLHAEDETSSIVVDYDPATTELSVQITEGRRSTYAPEELGAAIVDVVLHAASARVAEWGEQIEDDDRVTARPLPTVSETPVGRLAVALETGEIGMAPDAVTNRIVEMMSEMNRQLDATLDIVKGRATETFSSRTFGGNVTVTIDRAGLLQAVDVSPAWLAGARAVTITAEINGALEAARAKLEKQSANPLAGTPLEDFAALATDPDALIRMIRN